MTSHNYRAAAGVFVFVVLGLLATVSDDLGVLFVVGVGVLITALVVSETVDRS